MPKTRILIVEDSLTTAAHLQFILEKDEDLTVCHIASNGQEALEKVISLKPDVVVMDVHMPGMNGYETTKAILYETAVPIVICSSTWEPGEIAKTFKAVEVGAVTAIPKPPGSAHPDFAKYATDFSTVVKSMSEVKVVRRRNFDNQANSSLKSLSLSNNSVDVIGIGASTGGPLVLKDILGSIPKDYPIPIVVVQHIAPGFINGMVVWLQENCSARIKVASHREKLQPGTVYFAPDDCQMSVYSGYIHLHFDEPKEKELKPAIGYLFRSIAQQSAPNALGILLTGMGSDGAVELKQMRDKGSTTIAQDKQSSVVFGMPAAAIALGGVSRMMNPREIRDFILRLGEKSKK